MKQPHMRLSPGLQSLSCHDLRQAERKVRVFLAMKSMNSVIGQFQPRSKMVTI